jgi:F-type H+-transporting ATPase subunit delta
MAVRGVAKRYAQAAFQIAQEQGTLDQWLADLTTLADAASDPEVSAFFVNPNVRERDKHAALERIFARPEQQYVLNLARLLVDRRRFEIAPELLEVFRDLVLDARGIAIADVTTAVELTPAEREQIRTRLARIVGREVELRPHVDPSVIGGLVARIGDQLIDGSVSTQLRMMRAALTR